MECQRLPLIGGSVPHKPAITSAIVDGALTRSKIEGATITCSGLSTCCSCSTALHCTDCCNLLHLPKTKVTKKGRSAVFRNIRPKLLPSHRNRHNLNCLITPQTSYIDISQSTLITSKCPCRVNWKPRSHRGSCQPRHSKCKSCPPCLPTYATSPLVKLKP